MALWKEQSGVLLSAHENFTVLSSGTPKDNHPTNNEEQKIIETAEEKAQSVRVEKSSRVTGPII